MLTQTTTRTIVLSGLAILAVLILAVVVYSSGLLVPTSLPGTRVSSYPPTAQTTAANLSTSSTTLNTVVSYSLSPCSCTVEVPWLQLTQPYSTLHDLKNASTIIAVATVNSSQTISVDNIPVTIYNITVTTLVKGSAELAVAAGSTMLVGQVGGTLSGNTMALDGYPTLANGASYVFFLNPAGGIYDPNTGAWISADAPLSDYVAQAGFLTFMTQGGPQGLFSIQAGNVYSLDNAYPQSDAWLPVKVQGVPLAQFITEVTSA